LRSDIFEEVICGIEIMFLRVYKYSHGLKVNLITNSKQLPVTTIAAV